MKKLLVALLVLSLTMSFLSGFSETIDLDSMSYNELIELEFSVLEKIYTYDSGNTSFYYPGVYVVGEDIEAGSYLFKGVDFGDGGDRYGHVRVWINKEGMIAADNSKSIFYEMVYSDYNTPLQCNLKDGMCLDLGGIVFSAVRR